jgi:hypothetical protein
MSDGVGDDGDYAYGRLRSPDEDDGMYAYGRLKDCTGYNLESCTKLPIFSASSPE